MKGPQKSLLWQLQDRARKQDLECTRCKRVGLMTVDHIIPMYFIDGLGLKSESINHEWNFQFLCRGCNSLKRAGFDMTDPRTIVNLRRYVALAEEVYSLSAVPTS